MEIDLLKFQKIKRNFSKGWRTEKDRYVAKKFGKEFFDGERRQGYGGYNYDGRWVPVARRIMTRYNLDNLATDYDASSQVLDVGCAKGFLVLDLVNEGLNAYGLDISRYAINEASDKIKCRLVKGSADHLPYADKSFDAVVAINTLHNLEPLNLVKAVHEMQRVCRNDKNMYITIDAYTNNKEKKTLENFNLTAKTYMSVDEWKDFFKSMGYKGDLWWTIFKGDK